MPGLGGRAGVQGGHLIQLGGQVAALLLMAVLLQPGMLPCLLRCDAGVVIPVQQPRDQILGIVRDQLPSWSLHASLAHCPISQCGPDEEMA